jgi:hypothetical protein
MRYRLIAVPDATIESPLFLDTHAPKFAFIRGYGDLDCQLVPDGIVVL